MAIEDPNGRYSGLDKLAPAQSDEGSTASGHLRMMKDTMQRQWPGAAGAGLTRPMAVTEDEIESLQGANGALQPQINVLETNKMAAVPGSTQGNIAVFDSNGNVIDSGVPISAVTG